MPITIRLYDDELGTFHRLRRTDWVLRDALRHLEAGDIPRAVESVERARGLVRAALGCVYANEADRQTGRKIRTKAPTGGPARRRAPPDDVLAAEVRALHAKNPRLSWADICARVAKRHGLSRRTVERHARAADWRTGRTM